MNVIEAVSKEIWNQEGRPEGQRDRHWALAEHLVMDWSMQRFVTALLTCEEVGLAFPAPSPAEMRRRPQEIANELAAACLNLPGWWLRQQHRGGMPAMDGANGAAVIAGSGR